MYRHWFDKLLRPLAKATSPTGTPAEAIRTAPGGTAVDIVAIGRPSGLTYRSALGIDVVIGPRG